MESLNYQELKERVITLTDWLNKTNDDHFHWVLVKQERDFYRHRLEILDETGIPVIEARCITACYSQIKKGNL